MWNSNQVRFTARIVAFCVACAALPFAAANANSRPTVSSQSCGSHGDPTEVALPRWAQKLADDYAEECGSELDPALIAGMNKKEAEAAIEPLIEACKEGD